MGRFDSGHGRILGRRRRCPTMAAENGDWKANTIIGKFEIGETKWNSEKLISQTIGIVWH